MAVEQGDATIDELGGLDAIRERLLAERGSIIELYHHDVRAGQEASDEGSDDIVDRANNAYNRELLFSLSDGERSSLLRIDEALQRLELGQYGTCTACGSPIGVARLKAIPAARYCIGCQELAEEGMLDES